MSNDRSQSLPELSRIRLNIDKGILEVEGREGFVLQVYEDFKQSTLESRPQASESRKRVKEQEGVVRENGKKPRSSKGPRAKPRVLENLNLAASNGRLSLRDYYTQFAAKTNFERNLIFVYYLQNELKLETITADHVYSCYAAVKGKYPTAMVQSLYDTNHKRRWLNTESIEDIKLTTVGVNHLEHDMPRAE